VIDVEQGQLIAHEGVRSRRGVADEVEVEERHTKNP
jgi:hypothetical protein